MDSFIYTVTQLNNHSKSILENNLNNIWVSGEIVDFKVYGSGHAYFTLKDNNSEISCTWFNYQSINELENNINVTINGNVTIYNVKGNFQLQVKDSFIKGQGKESLKLLKLKKKLFKEGLFDKKYKNIIPEYPTNIAIITSIEGAVINDMINIFSRRAPYLKLFLCDVQVQGEKSSQMIIDFIKMLNIDKEIDLIIIARGGGNKEDFTSFNDEDLVRNIFNSNIPIITAIGHEIDTTLADLVSDLRCSTPSEAAELSVANIKDLLQCIDSLYEKIHSGLNNKIINCSLNIDAATFLTSFEKKIIYIDSYISQINNIFHLFINNIHLQLDKYNNLINNFNKSLKMNNLKSLKKIGFSIIKKNGKVINKVEHIYVKDKLHIDMYDGTVNINVGDIIKNEKK